MNSLKSKIFVFFLVLLSLAMALIWVLVYRTMYQHTQHQIENELSAGFAVVSNELENRRQYQRSVAELITQDFGLRSEIASFEQGNNVESLRVTLDNFRRRSNADFSFATNTTGHVLASTSTLVQSGDRYPFNEPLLKEDVQQRDAFVVRDGKLLHLFVTPIYAPPPNLIGWFALGYVLDDAATKRLSQQIGLQVSLLETESPTSTQRVLASSLPAADRAFLLRDRALFMAGHHALGARDHEQVLYSEKLGGDARIWIVLQRSLTEALRDYQTLQWQLVLIVLICLGLSALGAFLIASTVTRPLSRLIDYLRSTARGEYLHAAPTDKKGEIGALMQEFAVMQQAIAERESAIAQAAFRDALTGLPNRLRLQQLLQDQISKAGEHHTLAVLVLGLNHFKDINETLGHAYGDHLLRQVALRLQDSCRVGDMLARLGGDEFAVLLSHIERHDVIQATLHYQHVFAQPFQIENFSLTVNASIGIALYPEHGENPAMLLQRTEIAMFTSKEKRLPYALYNNQQNRYSLLRLSLMGELIGAIGRGELLLHYQPKLDLRTQQIVGVECLVRWQHPVHGFVRPDDFVPLAEQTGNVRHLTAWAIDTALHQVRQWRERGWALYVAVNVSAVDLQDPTLIAHIDAALQREQLSADALLLEITEGAVMSDVNHAVDMLGQLRARGIQLSIDDYGTGYSSMAQLKRLPVDELKIDKSFVLDIASNKDDAVIVRSTIELGHNMGLMVVAEGVESAEVLTQLCALGCDLAQGYYLTKPLAAPDLERWLTNNIYAVADDKKAMRKGRLA